MTPSFRRPSRTLRVVRACSLLVLLCMGANGCSKDAPAKSALVTTLPEAGWTACSDDNACEARWLSCRGWQAVNRDNGDQIEAWYARENGAYLSRAECDGPPVVKPAAFCRARQCTLQ